MKPSPVKNEFAAPASQVQYHDAAGGRRLAYARHAPKVETLPSVLFFGGFKSDMTGSKAAALDAHCSANAQGFVRFDYTGHGASSGAFTDGTIGSWLADALTIIDEVANLPGMQRLLLVGSSMGAWIALRAAMLRPERVAGLVGIASAPDFTERLIWQRLDAEQKRQLQEQGVYHAPSCYGQDPYPITRALIEDGRQHLLLDAPVDVRVPVRLLHGTQDEDVPLDISVLLMQQLTSNDVQLTHVKGGNHRLSEPSQLELLCGTVAELSKQLRA
jgi:pimeloyl-ACP methyl ester carboxylesterase